MREAPKAPCMQRKTIMLDRLVAVPHSSELSMKPDVLISRILRSPYRRVKKPVSGIIMADATIYEVSTHVIWSVFASGAGIMCGRATLMMVLSRISKMATHMTVKMMSALRCGRCLLSSDYS